MPVCVLCLSAGVICLWGLCLWGLWECVYEHVGLPRECATPDSGLESTHRVQILGSCGEAREECVGHDPHAVGGSMCMVEVYPHTGLVMQGTWNSSVCVASVVCHAGRPQGSEILSTRAPDCPPGKALTDSLRRRGPARARWSHDSRRVAMVGRGTHASWSCTHVYMATAVSGDGVPGCWTHSDPHQVVGGTGFLPCVCGLER